MNAEHPIEFTPPVSVGIGVLGGAAFIAREAVLPAIDAADGAHLAAIASQSGTIDPRWGGRQVDGYDDVLAHPDVEAVYLPLSNGLHEEWTIKAALAGKHVLCEKPLAPTAAAGRRMANACRERGVILAEAWMTPFGPRWQRVLDDITTGVIGNIDQIDARFTFTIGPEHDCNYRWNPQQGGGALLDVGIYTLGLPVALWGTDVERVEIHDRIDDSRAGLGAPVDARTDATLTWFDGQQARIVCSFIDDEEQRLTATGATGSLTVSTDAFTGGIDALEHHIGNGRNRTVSGEGGDPYQAMVEAFGRAVRGLETWLRPADESVLLLELLDRIANERVVA